MSINRILEKEGITVITPVNEEVKNKVIENLTNKICDCLSFLNLNKENYFNKLYSLNLYYAKFQSKFKRACYVSKNKSIYINIEVEKDNIEDFILHEVIHYLQEVLDKNNNIKKMGLCSYSYLSISGLSLNEAATQYLASYIQNKKYEDVKYFGINFKTNSPNYYPIECALINQLDYLIENNILFQSTLLADDDFNNEMLKYFSKDQFQSIIDSLDDMLLYEEKITKLNDKILNISSRNKSIDRYISKINSMKQNLLVKFMKTQNLIISSYFDNLFCRIENFEQIDYLRKKLYNFRNYIGTADGYIYYDSYYMNMIEALNKKSINLENSYSLTSLLVVKDNIFMRITRKLLSIIKLNQSQESYDKNDINSK